MLWGKLICKWRAHVTPQCEPALWVTSVRSCWGPWWDSIIPERPPMRMAAVTNAPTIIATICFIALPPFYLRIKAKNAIGFKIKRFRCRYYQGHRKFLSRIRFNGYTNFVCQTTPFSLVKRKDPTLYSLRSITSLYSLPWRSSLWTRFYNSTSTRAPAGRSKESTMVNVLLSCCFCR